MSAHRSPAEEPICACGAQLDENSPTLCRKCAARSRWQRRRGGAHRHSDARSRRGPADPTN